MVANEWHCICTRQKKEASDIIDGILNSVIDKMEERKSRVTLFESRVKNPQNLGKNSNVKAKKKQGTVKEIEENEKQAELKRVWNAIHEIKSLLSKHTADNSQTLENRPNPSNKEKSDNSERGSCHGNVSNVIKSKTEASPLKRDPKRQVKHFITDYFEKKSSDDYFRHIDKKNKERTSLYKENCWNGGKVKTVWKGKVSLDTKSENLESENSKLKTVTRKDENVKI